jgi:hypothetical protein
VPACTRSPRCRIFSKVSALVQVLRTGTIEGTFENVCLPASAARKVSGHTFWKVLSMATFYSKCTRTLTFENVCLPASAARKVSGHRKGRDRARECRGGRVRRYGPHFECGVKNSSKMRPISSCAAVMAWISGVGSGRGMGWGGHGGRE